MNDKYNTTKVTWPRLPPRCDPGLLPPGGWAQGWAGPWVVGSRGAMVVEVASKLVLVLGAVDY